MTTSITAVALVFTSAVIGSFGAVFLKLGAQRLRFGLRHIISIQSLLGVMLYVVSSFFYVAGVRQGELSVLYPMISLGYVFTLLWSRIFFKEPITRQKYVALGLIIVGISMIGVGAHK